MAKLSQENIELKDIQEYIDDYSDFAFELKVLNKFEQCNFICEHGGTYEDPISNKIRQFDLRAKIIDKEYALMLAIECKNIRRNYPLVAHCVKRTSSESYHYILNSSPTGPITIPQPAPWVECNSFSENQSIYKSNELVAKALDQIGRHYTDKTIINSDSNIFEKMTQSINSSFELLKIARDLGEIGNIYSFILPILVVPDNTLWQISYDNDCNYEDNIQKVERISYYIDRSWDIGTNIKSVYKISHMEIITYSHIDNFVKEFFSNQTYLEKIFNKSI